MSGISITLFAGGINELETALGIAQVDIRTLAAALALCEQQRDTFAARLKQAEAVIVAAQAVVDRWDGPTWEAIETAINRLRVAIAQSKS